MAEEAQKQTYDNLLKRMFEHQAAAIIPLLFSKYCNRGSFTSCRL